VEHINWSVEQIQRGNYAHLMLKEMHEQPQVVKDALRGRLDVKNGLAVMGGLLRVDKKLRKTDHLTILGCGSAYYAGLIGQQMLRKYAGVRTEVELASEYRASQPIVGKRDTVIAVTQSGETIDTLMALREAKNRGALALGIVNAVGSSIPRETDAGIYMHAGPEIAVASTKAFVAMLTSFALLTLHMGRQRGMSQATGQEIARELEALPEKIERIIAQGDVIKALAKRYAGHGSMLYLGRNFNAPVASEGALKLKEIAYIHAEGYAAGEMKHGPIALLDENFPVVAIATKGSVYDKMMSNIAVVRARQAPVLAVATEGDSEILKHAKDVIYVPETIEMLSPILNVIPLQLFAYHVAVARGLDPDQPRNLAKSVTVE
jgi:glucosamine--fructose-6-phosphate aminotransferase (isomerizing)